MSKRNFLITIGCLVLAFALALAWDFYPMPSAEARIRSIPLHGIALKGSDIPINDYEKELLNGAYARKILYTYKGQAFIVTLMDGTLNRNAVHDPAYCFTGAGWQITRERPLSIPKGQAIEFSLEKSNQVSSALYWFSDSDTNFTSPLQYWWATSLRRLTLGYSSSEPVLVLVQPLDHNFSNWDDLSLSFIPLINF